MALFLRLLLFPLHLLGLEEYVPYFLDSSTYCLISSSALKWKKVVLRTFPSGSNSMFAYDVLTANTLGSKENMKLNTFGITLILSLSGYSSEGTQFVYPHIIYYFWGNNIFALAVIVPYDRLSHNREPEFIA